MMRAAMKRQKPRAVAGPDVLAKDVQRLSRLLTRDREDLPHAYLRDEGLRHAYLHYYLPANSAKVHLPLRELSLHPAGLLERERLRVLDLGSGPGTAILGILAHFQTGKYRPALEFTGVDHVAENLDAAQELFREQSRGYPAPAGLSTLQRTISGMMAGLEGPYDIIVLSNVLNELFPGEERRTFARVEIVNALLTGVLADDGSCVLIEPALRETSREMLLVRDGLIERGFTVYSPCLMQEHCPALVNPKDWCHEDIPWTAPDLVREIDRLTGLRKDALKFSYCVLRKHGRSLADVRGRDALRVVSEPLVTKGKTELYVCGSGGRRIAMRQDKERSEANAAFDQLRRGAVAWFENLVPEEKRYRVRKDTRVTLLSLPGGKHP